MLWESTVNTMLVIASGQEQQQQQPRGYNQSEGLAWFFRPFPNLLKKSTDAPAETKKFTVVWKVIIIILQSHWSLPLFGNRNSPNWFSPWGAQAEHSLVPRPHPAHARRRGRVSQSPNPWASSRSVERPIKSQSSVYWNNAEVRTSTLIVCSNHIMRFIIQHWVISLTITRLHNTYASQRLGHQILSSQEGWVWAWDQAGHKTKGTVTFTCVCKNYIIAVPWGWLQMYAEVEGGVNWR